MTNATSQIINPNIDWNIIIKNILFSGRYVSNSLVNLMLNFGVSLTQDQISKIGIVVSLVAIYIVMEFAQKLKPIIKMIIIALLVWTGLGFFVG